MTGAWGRTGKPSDMFRRLLLLGIAVVLLTACAVLAQRETRAQQMRHTMPVGQRLGDLTLLGAVEWSSPRGDFGGFSGLELEEDGYFTALTDKGHTARARLRHDTNGILTGIDGLKVARLRDAQGKYLQFPDSDSEALRRGADGAWYVAFENTDRISRFDTLDGPEQVVVTHPGLDALYDNGGLESLLVLPRGHLKRFPGPRKRLAIDDPRTDGKPEVPEPPQIVGDTLVGIVESGEDWTKGFDGYIVDGEAVETFTFARHGWYAPTDIALGPNGEWIYVLERRFTLIGGFAMRIRRFPLAELRAGATIDAALLLDTPAAPLNENMEGLAATTDAQGRTILYVLSDDNFNVLQRTLLLQFRVEN